MLVPLYVCPGHPLSAGLGLSQRPASKSGDSMQDLLTANDMLGNQNLVVFVEAQRAAVKEAVVQHTERESVVFAVWSSSCIPLHVSCLQRQIAGT